MSDICLKFDGLMQSFMEQIVIWNGHVCAHSAVILKSVCMSCIHLMKFQFKMWFVVAFKNLNFPIKMLLGELSISPCGVHKIWHGFVWKKKRISKLFVGRMRATGFTESAAILSYGNVNIRFYLTLFTPQPLRAPGYCRTPSGRAGGWAGGRAGGRQGRQAPLTLSRP